MSDTVQCWLVERTFDDRNLVTVVYATPDGERYRRQERSAHSIGRNPVSAAAEIPDEDLEPVPDEATREQYAAEAERTAANYDPDEAI